MNDPPVACLHIQKMSWVLVLEAGVEKLGKLARIDRKSKSSL